MGAFAGALGSLWVEIGARIEKLEAGLSQASKAIDHTISDTEKKFSGFDRLGDRLTGIGAGISAAVTLPIAAIGTAAIKASGDFDSAMRLVSARGDITGKDLAMLSRQAEELGAKTNFSSRQAAEGMAEFAGAGFNANEIYAALPGTLNLAAAAQTSVGQAATVVKDILGQFQLTAGETGRVVDVLAKAANESSGTLTQMANSLTYVGPVAKAAGLSLEQTNAALIVLDKAGIRGEQAGTALRGMLASLTPSSDKAAEALDSLGVKTSDASGKFLPFPAIIEQFRNGLAKIPNEAERSATLVNIFGREGLAAANVLTQSGAPALLAFEEKLRNAGGEAQRTATVMNSGLGGALERARGSIETAAQKIGDALAPALIQIAGLIESGANKIAAFAGYFQTLPDGIQTTVIAFTALVAAIGPALLIAGQFAGAITAISTALPLASQGVTALTGVIGVSVASLAAWTAGIVAAGAALAVTLKAAYDAKQASKELEEANKNQIDTLSRLEKHLKSQGADLSDLQSALKRGHITQREYEQGLRDIALQIGKTKKATTEIKDDTTDLDKAQRKITDAISKASKSFADQGKSVEQTSDKFKSLAPRYTEVTALGEKLNAEHRKHIQTLVELRRSLEEGGSATVKLIQPTEELTRAVSEVNVALLEMPAAVRAALEPYRQLDQAVAQIQSVEEAFKRQGITSTTSLKQTAEQARKDYEAIKNSGIASARDIEIAWVKMEEARIAAARAAGEEIPRETELALEKIKSGIERSTKDTRDVFGTWSRQVSTIVTDLGRDIANILFDSDTSFAEKGKAVLKSLGEAVVRSFVEPATAALSEMLSGIISDLIGGKGFGGLLDSIKNVGSAIADLVKSAGKAIGAIGGSLSGAGDLASVIKPGELGDVAAGAGKIPTGGVPGTGASGGIGGLAGGVNLVSGLVSAISGVFSAIGTFRLEGTMNAVEENTRYSRIYLGEGDNSILGQLYRIASRTDYVPGLLDGINAKLDDWLQPLTSQLQHMVEAIPMIQRRLDECSHNTLWGSEADRDNSNILAAMRDLISSRPPVINVYVNGVQQPSSAIQVRLQGGGVFV